MTRGLCGAWLGCFLLGISVAATGCGTDAPRPRLDAAADPKSGDAAGPDGSTDAGAIVDPGRGAVDLGGPVVDAEAPLADAAGVDVAPLPDGRPRPAAGSDGPLIKPPSPDGGAAQDGGTADIGAPAVDATPPIEVPPAID